jgi:hypothetical protein
MGRTGDGSESRRRSGKIRKLPQWWDWKWFGTLLVALYAAGLSTYTAWQKRRENRSEVRVTLTFGMFLPPGRGQPVTTISMNASNHAFRDVTFSSAFSFGLQFKGSKETVTFKDTLTDVKFPRTLKYSEAISVVAQHADFKAAAAEVLPNLRRGKVRVVARDQLDRKFYSRWVNYEL